MDIFLQYYGLDWLSMVMGFAGAWLVTEKNKYGFILTIISVTLALIVALMAQQFGFVFANVITIGIATRGFMKWKAEPPATG